MTAKPPQSPLLADLPERLAHWSAGGGAASYDAILDFLSRKLAEIGVPVWRSFVGIETLHPVQSGRTVTWSAGDISTFERERDGVSDSADYLNSPVRIVDETGEPQRIRLTETDLGMPTLKALREAGGTDYVIHPLPFVDRTRTAIISFATRAAVGFAETDLERLAMATAVAGPFFERLAVREVAINLLDTYVGPRSGRRVFEGLIDRGELESLPAAILFADLRNYTELSGRIAGSRTVEFLDTFFEVLGEPIADNGGEILKFLGDGLLAVFPGADDPQAGCRAALAAARAAGNDFARVPAAAGLRAGETGYGIGLHYGEVGYGNVGSRTRLDFTVIGQAVNVASRLQDLCKVLPYPIVASAQFAAHLPGVMAPCGRHQLRGLAEPVDVFALKDET